MLLAAALVVLGVTTAAPASASVCPTVGPGGAVTPTPAPLVDWSGCNLAGAALSGAHLDVANLTGADLTGATLSVANLTGARLAGANLTGVTATHVVLRQADLTGADLTGANLGFAAWSGATVAGTVLTGATLDFAASADLAGVPASLPAGWHLVRGYLLGHGANVQLANLSGIDLSGYDLSQALLSRVDLTGSTLTSADLSGTHLDQVEVQGLVITSANLSGIDASRLTGVPAVLPTGWVVRAGHLLGPTALLVGSFAAVDLTGLDLSGATLSSALLSNLSLVGTDLSTATMHLVSSSNVVSDATTVLPSGWSVTAGYLVGPGAQLQSAVLSGVDLTGRSLPGILLPLANLNGATLADASLIGADLTQASVTSANLNRADLSGAFLNSANFTLTSLRGAHFEGAILGVTSFYGADLTGATGLGSGSDDPFTTWTNATCPDGRAWNQHANNRCTSAVDTTAPRVSMPAPPEFQYSPATMDQMVFAVAASDGAAGDLSVRLRVSTGTAGGTAMSAYRTGAWSLRPHGTTQTAIPLDPGRRVCVQAQAKDPAGSVSAWSALRCSSTVTDDIQLGRSRGWTESFTPGWFHQSVARTTTHGAFLAGLIRDVRRMGVVASTCSTCGTVALYVGSRKVGSISLHSSASRSRVLLMLPRLPSRLHGDVRVVVTSPSGRMVRIDGVAISAL
jgi:uncharacterized protein YjbI with pentapeptide repeats